MQPCSRSSRRHITKSCWMYCVSIHTTSSFFKIPSVHPLDMPLWCLPLWPPKHCNLQTPFVHSCHMYWHSSPGTLFSQMGLWQKNQWGVLLPLVYGHFKFQLHHFNPLFYCRSIFSLGRNFTFSSFPATEMMMTQWYNFLFLCFLCCIKALTHFFHMCVQEICTVLQHCDVL
jgi:hypothetical protein